MKSFSEFSFGKQLFIMLGAAALIVVTGEFLYFPPVDSLNTRREANQVLEGTVTKLEKENESLRPLRDERNRLRAQNVQLEQQLATQRTIVPAEKNADDYIRDVQGAALQSGVNIRRLAARADIPRELNIIEVPFDLTLDGTCFTVMEFFRRLGGLTRIVNVGNLNMRPIGKGGGGKYTITPNETIAATCTATKFYSREAPPPGERVEDSELCVTRVS